MTTHVSFETAKLLKEKGFDMPCTDYYTSRGLLNSNGWGDIIYEDGGFGSGEPEKMIRFDYSDFSKKQKEEYYLCPTIAEVVMWLYEKHSLWILPLPTVCGYFAWKIIDMQDDPNRPIERPPYNDVDGVDYKTPTEAYEAAIVYALNNIVL